MGSGQLLLIDLDSGSGLHKPDFAGGEVAAHFSNEVYIKLDPGFTAQFRRTILTRAFVKHLDMGV